MEPIPEFEEIIIPIAALLGIFLLIRVARKKKP